MIRRGADRQACAFGNVADFQLVDEIERGREKAAGRAIFDQQRLHFEVWRIEQVVERGVVEGVFVVDVDTMLDQIAGDFLIGNDGS